MTDLPDTIAAPEPPALLPSSWERIDASIGSANADFRVDEIPLYEHSGEGEHLFLLVEKEGLNTQDVVRELAAHAGVSARDIGYAGMKDRYAVTTQWFSVTTRDDPTQWTWQEGVRLLDHTRHGNKLRTGHLQGNRFRIRLLGLDDPSLLTPRVESLRASGVLNGFDAQRFGRGGHNLEDALRWARRGGRVSHFKKKLYASVLQSQVFNHVLRTRAEQDLLRVVHGDVLRLEGSQSVFVSEDPVVDEERRARNDVHLTGPIFGPRSRAAEGEALAIEQAAIRALGLEEDALSRIARSGRGTRRDLLIGIADLTLRIEDAHAATLEFSLPAGAYATNVIRHVLRRDWDAPLRPVPSHVLVEENA